MSWHELCTIRGMKKLSFHKQKIFRQTQDVIFYDISVPGSNASDLVVHETAATSPPNDESGNKQYYIHSHQIDNNRVISGERTFELINPDWDQPYVIVHLSRDSGALMIPKGTYHRSVSGINGSVVINQAIRDDLFQSEKEFEPVSVCDDEKLSKILVSIQPIIK